MLKLTWPWALPADLIRSYFGEKVALFFAFTAHYTSLQLPLALLGFVTQLQIFQNGYDRAFLLFAFSACTSVWSIFMLESWKRNEWVHTVQWGMSNFHVVEKQRPEFDGEVRASLVDGEDVLFYPSLEKSVTLLKSWAVTFLLIIINLAVQTVVFSFRTWAASNEDSGFKQVMMLLASLFISMQIYLADTIYKAVAIHLTANENHRLDSEYYDSLIVKFALFQLLNNYSSLFYIAFVKVRGRALSWFLTRNRKQHLFAYK